jgi:peptide/nickel transport system permease protein
LLTYLVQRLLLVAVVIWGAATLAFTLLYLSGDPTNLLLPLDAAPEVREAFRRAQGYDQPLLVQYGRYLSDLLRGDFGTSLRNNQPALRLVLESFPPTLRLAGLSLLVAVLIAVPAGVIAANRRGSVAEFSIMTGALLGQAMPVFWLALMLILVFGLNLRWLPISGSGSWRHYVLPVATLATFSAASIARLTRGGVLSELRSDHVRTARAKGLPHRGVLYKHALRNAAIPVVTVIGLQLGTLVSGAIITETIFAWPGIGRFVLLAVSQRDFPVVQASVVVFAFLLALINLAVDLLYAVLDPRIRYG